MTKLAVISGGIREPSSTRLLADRIVAAVDGWIECGCCNHDALVPRCNRIVNVEVQIFTGIIRGQNFFKRSNVVARDAQLDRSGGNE